MADPIISRLRVRFRKRDDTHFFFGFVKEVSGTRITLTADRTIRSGNRVLIEVPEPAPGFYLEGEVERSLHVPPSLRKIRDPTMVIRLLRPEELLSKLIPELEFRPYVITKDSLGSGSGGAGEGEAGELESEVDANGVIEAYVVGFGEEEKGPNSGVFPIRYPSSAEFHLALRHAEQSALLVPTPFPAPKGDMVELRIDIMGVADKPVVLQAQVVQHLPPNDSIPTGGMAVVFVNPATALGRLRALAGSSSRRKAQTGAGGGE